MIFKKIILFFIRLFSSLLYKILPAGICSRIAMSRGAKMLTGMASVKDIALYSLKYGIKLRLTREEAQYGYLQLGQLNPIETGLVRKHLREGQVFFDIGAHVDGWYSILASRIVKDTGHVYCFEPIPAFFSRLNENIALNGCRNVTQESHALSNVNKKEKFFISGPESSLQNGSEDNGLETVVVDTITLDEYTARKGIKRVDFIKIDVEGVERRVIEGAAETIGKYRPLLLVEVVEQNLARFNTKPEELVEYIMGLGYTPYVISTGGLKAYNESNRTSTTPNMFFVPMPEPSRQA